MTEESIKAVDLTYQEGVGTMDFFSAIEEYARSNRNKIARLYHNTTITYGELIDQSDALAHYLINTCGEDRSPIIIYGHKQNEMIISFLASTKSGHPYIPIDITFPEKRIEDIIENSGAKTVIAISTLTSTPQGIEVINQEQLNDIILHNRGGVLTKNYKVEGDDVYYILYTSGSTGKPKGVQITKNCIESFIAWFKKHCIIKNDAGTFMDQVSYSFDVSVISVYIGLLMGRTIWGIDKDMVANFKMLFESFKKSKIAMWISTPSLVEMCMVDENFNKKLLPDLEKLFVAGEVLTTNLVQKVFERFEDIEVINGYGPTEATVLATAIGIDNDQAAELDPIPLGYPMDNGVIKIVNENGLEVSEGEKGEIILIGDSVSIGYYNNPELTKKSFFQVKIGNDDKRAYRTGDVGYRKNGLIYYSGRKDFQIKVDGFRVELEDVENNLRKIDFISNAVVLPVKRDNKINHLYAFVTLNKTMVEEKEIKIVQRIKEELKKLVPYYMVPRQMKIKEVFPTNPNGKINRELLMEELK